MSNLTGQQFGNYRLTRHLGTGGFGEVYLGTHVHLQREAAIKLLLKLDKTEIELFHTEAQIISHLVHPRIVTLFDYDVEDGRPFIVMMYAEHGSLRARYAHNARMTPVEVVKFITQAAQGLQFAHDQRIVHRDIKPGNMLLRSGDELQLSDFGLAVMWSNTHPIGDQYAQGTRGYMAPEQFLGQPHPASDQYALAITAYEWLTGTLPMAHATMGLGLLQVAHPETPIPSVRSVLPSLAPKIDDVLQRALASSWQARFPSVSEFAEELARALGSQKSATKTQAPVKQVEPSAPFERIPLDTPVPLTSHSRSTQVWDSDPASFAAPVAEIAARNAQAALPWNTAPAPSTPPRPREYAPPPPPDSRGFYPLPGPRYYPHHVTSSPAGTPRLKKPRPLLLPITRTHDKRNTWLWFGAYLAILAVLSLPLSLVFSIIGATANAPAWGVAVLLIELPLLTPLSTTLAGTFFGKWRGTLAPPIMAFLWFLQIAILAAQHPITTSSSQSGNTSSSTLADWFTFVAVGIGLCLPSLSAFLTGWIYQRRRTASFGMSFVSQLAGLALLEAPLVILIGIGISSGNPTLDPVSIFADVFSVLVFILPIFPTALLAAVLEVALHALIAKTQKSQ